MKLKINRKPYCLRSYFAISLPHSYKRILYLGYGRSGFPIERSIVDSSLEMNNTPPKENFTVPECGRDPTTLFIWS